MFKITLDSGQDVLGYTAGKMRRYRIKIIPGDRVKVEVSPTTCPAAASSTGTASPARLLRVE
jgi:translation initiation factor IF-1